MGAPRAPCCRPHLLGLCSLPRRLAPLQPVSFTHPEEVGEVLALFCTSLAPTRPPLARALSHPAPGHLP